MEGGASGNESGGESLVSLAIECAELTISESERGEVVASVGEVRLYHDVSIVVEMRRRVDDLSLTDETRKDAPVIAPEMREIGCQGTDKIIGIRRIYEPAEPRTRGAPVELSLGSALLNAAKENLSAEGAA